MFDTNFCIDSNIPSCFQILVSELELLNIPIVTYEDGSNKTIVYLLNVAWSLVTNRKRLVIKVNEQNETILNLKAKVNFVEESNKNNLSLLENEKKQSLLLTDLLSKVKSEKDICISQIREFKKETYSLQSNINKQQLQFEHDIRRKNCLIEELKIKLFKLLGPDSQRNSERSISKLTTDVPIRGERKLTNKCLSNLQNNIQNLLMENVNLRNCLLKIYVLCFKNKNNLDDGLIVEKKERLLKLPYQELIDEIEEDIITQINSLLK